MFKSQETKVHGSIRKSKFGACGVILALAMLVIAFGSNNVSADEVKPTTPATTEVAKPTTETAKPETKAEVKPEAKPETKAEETVKPVEAPTLDATVEKAKSVGIKVTEKEKVGYDTEDQAKADEKAQVEVNCTPKVRQKKSNFWGVLL